MVASERRALKVGYLWQIQQANIHKITATPLHVKAVIGGLEHRGHRVRLVTRPDGAYGWSDNRTHWQPARLGLAATPPFRLVESALRGVQSRLRLPYLNLFDSYRFAQASVAALAGYDVLYERYWLLNTGGLMAARRLGIPLILEVNGDLFAEYEQLGIRLSRAQWAAIRTINRRLFHGADHIVTVSEPLRQRTIERWQLDPANVTAINNGAHVERFAQPSDVASTRARYGVNGGPVVMFVGSFKPWHGLDLLLEAFAPVAAARPDATLVLVGDGPTRSEVEQQVADLNLTGRVIFTGRVPHDEVAALLSLAHVAVLNPRVSPASMSQSPLKLFEYMAAGKPIVAPALPNVEQVLTHRKTGLLVPPNDARALADALLLSLQDETLRAALGHAAQQDALAKHSWDRTVAEIEAIMQRLTPL